MSAPAGNTQDLNGEIANTNSAEEKEDDQIAEVQESIEDENQELNNDTTNPEESDNQASSDQGVNDTEKSPSPENKIRTPSPPKSPRKTPSRSRSQTPPRQTPAPKEQIGNGHAHPEEINA